MSGEAASGTPGNSAVTTSVTLESLTSLQGDGFKSVLPEEYRGKGYMKDVNSYSDLLKKFDGAQALLGQRVATPAATAADDEWTAYHSRTAPESADAYEIPKIEGVGEDKIKAVGESKLLKGILHQAKVSPFQARILLHGFLGEIFKAEKAENERTNQSFSKLADQVFGADKAEALLKGKAYLAAYLPESAKGLLDKLDVNTSAVLFAAVNNMAKKLGEDPFKGGTGNPPGGGTDSKDELIKRMQAIQKDPVWVDPFKDQAKHKELMRQMTEIREALKKFS